MFSLKDFRIQGNTLIHYKNYTNRRQNNVKIHKKLFERDKLTCASRPQKLVFFGRSHNKFQNIKKTPEGGLQWI